MMMKWASLTARSEAPSVNVAEKELRPRQGQYGMMLALATSLALFDGGSAFVQPAAAQSAQGLFWQCVPASSTNPQPKYCPVSGTYPLPTGNSAAAIGGSSIFRSVTLTNTAVAVDANPGTISSIQVANTDTSAALCYLQIYDAAAASVTVGTTTPTVTLAVAAATVLTMPFSTPLQFSTAISIAATTTAGGSTACSPILQSTLIGYK